MIRTNSDHLMIDMLRTTPLGNLGSYWLRSGYKETGFTRAVVKGFEGRVAFGCLRIDNRPLSTSAEAFLETLKARL